MKTGNTQTIQFAMKHCRVTETHQPFRMLQKLGEIQFVDDSDAAITASGKPNCFYLFIVKVFLKYSCTKIIISSENMIFGKKSIIVNRLKSMFFQPIYGILHFF